MTPRRLPLLAVLEATLAWQRGPSEDRRLRVGDALGALVAAVGGSGAYLEADQSMLPGLVVGWGTLANGPTPGDRPDGMVLAVDEGRATSGRLWLDASGAAADPIVRAVELALESAWTRADARQLADRLEALDAATRAIAGLHPLERVLQLIADRVRDLISADYAALGIVGADGVIERFVTSGVSREQREAIGPRPRGRGLLGLIIRENASYRIPDIGAHPSSSGFPPGHPSMRSFLGVPIQVMGRSVGNFYLTNKRHAMEFSEADEHLAKMFALHAGVAIENARLHEQVQRLAVVDERVRIGKDLHDGIIQAIYAVGLSLEDVPDMMADDPAEAATRIDRAIDSLGLTIRDIRNFIFGLRPELVEQGGLVAGLAALATEFRLNTVIDVELDAPDDVPDPGADRSAELLKIAREALSNIARHSRASRAFIRIGFEHSRVGFDHSELVLTVSDNGTGFVVDDHRDGRHQGLANMRTRAADLGGRLEIDHVNGGGTRIVTRVPANSPGAAGAPAGGPTI